MGSFLRKRVYCALLLGDHIHFRSFLLFHYAILYARIAITMPKLDSIHCVQPGR